MHTDVGDNLYIARSNALLGKYTNLVQEIKRIYLQPESNTEVKQKIAEARSAVEERRTSRYASLQWAQNNNSSVTLTPDKIIIVTPEMVENDYRQHMNALDQFQAAAEQAFQQRENQRFENNKRPSKGFGSGKTSFDDADYDRFFHRYGSHEGYEAGYQDGLDGNYNHEPLEGSSYEEGFNEGYEEGYNDGHQYNNGYEAGKKDGYRDGLKGTYDDNVSDDGSSYDSGYNEGYEKGYDDGRWQCGYDDGEEEGYRDSFTGSDYANLLDGDDDYSNGYNKGYEKGYDDGRYNLGSEHGERNGYQDGLKGNYEDLSDDGSPYDDGYNKGYNKAYQQGRKEFKSWIRAGQKEHNILRALDKGHAKEKHVGKTQNDLILRMHTEYLEKEWEAKYASSFVTVEELEAAVILAISDKANQDQIRTWLANTKKKQKDVYYEHESIRGRLIPRIGGDHDVKIVHGIKVVLWRDPNLPTGYKILTAFPVA